MSRWMGSHFHDWVDYHEVAFSVELGCIFAVLGG